MTNSEISVHRDGAVTIITLDRPHARNALTLGMIRYLTCALDDADLDPRVRAVVVTGSGSAFSVGLDLSAGESAAADLCAEDADGWTRAGYREPAGRVNLRIRSMSIPVFAAVNGDAVGGGATLLLAMDARFASNTARFGFVFTRRGLCPEGGATWLLPRIVGPSTAMDWLCSGRVFTAEEAHAAGLVGRLTAPDRILDATVEHAHRIVASTADDAVAIVRRLVRASESGLEEAMLRESEYLVALSDSPNGREGIASFLERRSPKFTASRLNHPRPDERT